MIPVESPTVAIADTLSNKESKKSMFSILDMIIAAENENVIYKKKMQVAFLVMKSSKASAEHFGRFSAAKCRDDRKNQNGKSCCFDSAGGRARGTANQHQTDDQKSTSLSQSRQVNTVESGSSCTDRLKS